MDGTVLREPRRGGRISAADIAALARAARAGRLLAGPGIRLTRTPGGTSISAVPYRTPAGRVPPGADVDAGQVRAGSTGEIGSYIVQTSGGTYTTDFMETSLAAGLPAGARVIVHPVLCRAAAGD